MTTFSPFWAQLGAVSPTTLAEARVNLHWAAQVVMAVGNSWIEERPDDSHTVMSWSREHAALVGEPLKTGHRAGLLVGDLSLVVFDPDGKVIRGLPLDGKQMEGAVAWMAEMIVAEGGGDVTPLRYRNYDMPPHPGGIGQSWDMGDAEPYRELACWFANAAMALTEVAEKHPGASPVRCWPHHFDIATLINIDPDGSRTIGVGMSPGDDSYDQPYWYVTPSPPPNPIPGGPPDKPPLAVGGTWHRDRWFGAVLPGAAFVESRDQLARLREFVDNAIAAERVILDGG